MANNALSKFKKLQEDATAFFYEKDLERPGAESRSRLRRFAHFCLLVGRSFVRNRCPVRASALAYSSLLALIPMLAVILSISTGILKSQGEEPIRAFIDNLVSHVAPYTTPAVKPGADSAPAAQALAAAKREEAVQKINEFISNTQSGTLGVTGMIALVAVAIAMLIRIEAAFNDIWGVTRSRSWYTQVLLYWAVISLGPILLVVGVGLNTGPYFETTKKLLFQMPVVGNFVFKLLPVLVLSVMFGMFYQFMPNTRVQPLAAAVGGLVAGGLWHLNNVIGVHFVSRVASNNAIYGSLGMVPVFMVGLYLGWLILLFGAQVAYAFQNRQVYLQEKQAGSINQRGREFIALRLMVEVAQQFHDGRRPPSVTWLGAAVGAPSQLISQIVQSLIQSRLLVEVADSKTGYAPARPLDLITEHDVLMALRTGQGQELDTREDPDRACVRREYDRVCQAEQKVAGAVTLLDLINREKNIAS